VLACTSGAPAPAGRAAVPVETQDRGVVSEIASRGAHDGRAEGVNGLAGVQVTGKAERVGHVQIGRVAFEHAVGDEDDAITGCHGELLHPEVIARPDAERKVDVQLDLLDVSVAQS